MLALGVLETPVPALHVMCLPNPVRPMFAFLEGNNSIGQPALMCVDVGIRMK